MIGSGGRSGKVESEETSKDDRKRELANEKLSRVLVTMNFTESGSSGPEAMWLLHSTSSSLKK